MNPSHKPTRQDLSQCYNQLKPRFLEVRDKIVHDLTDIVGQMEYVDAVYGRVKLKKNFVDKVLSDPKKYDPPFRAVEDLIGIRILVLFHEIGQKVADIVRKSIFPPLEFTYRRDENPRIFGYEGYQSVHSIPQGILDVGFPNDFPQVFELQVRTLFQHAWLEPEHEINYKNRQRFEETLEYEYTKKFSWLAASSWGCDRMLQDLFEKYRDAIADSQAN